jgi:K+-sensing histidine kinase KdpD
VNSGPHQERVKTPRPRLKIAQTLRVTLVERTWSRRIAGVAAGIVAVVLVAAALVPVRDDVRSGVAPLLFVLGVVVAALVGGRVAAVVVGLLAALAYNVAFIVPYWNLKVDAAEDWVALAVFTVVAVVVGTIVARERVRRAEADRRREEVERLSAELRAQVDERARLAEEARRIPELEALNEVRSALLRSVSHDLRTPLATIRAVATDLRDGTEFDAATRTELLDTVCDEAERLDRLVANLLSLTRIEAGALRPERQAVDLAELLRDRVRRLDRLLRRVKVQLEIPADLPLVDADYTQLDLVVTNLLENAARYAPDRTYLRIAAEAAGDLVRVRVIDCGIGIPHFERERVFEPFRRGEGSSSSGIGLAICKEIITAHGGTIAVEPTPGGGATFVFTVPVFSDHRLPAGRPGGPSAGRSGQRAAGGAGGARP